RRIANAVRQDELPVVDERPAGVNDVRNVTFPFVPFRSKEGLFQLANGSCRVVQIEQGRPDTVFSHWTDAMSKNQPASLGFNRRATVTELHELPGLLRLLQ